MVFHSHIGVLAFPFGTHAAPLLTLVRRIASASSPGTQFSFFNSAVSNQALFNNGKDNDTSIRAYDVWDGTPEGGAFTGTHFEAVGLFLKASPANFQAVIEEAERDAGLKITCFITDAFLWFAAGLAEERGVPWVAFWTAGSCSLSAHAYTDQIVKKKSTAAAAEEEQKLSFIPGLENVALSDLPPEIFLDKNPSPLATTINNMVESLPKSTAVVLNSFEEIDPLITADLKSKFRHFLSVGPSLLCSSRPSPADKSGCLPWLDGQPRPRSVVYISFGTVIVPPEHELAALAEALEVSRVPFLWSINERGRKSLPEGFVERAAGSGQGKVVPWAPQAEVLGHGSVGAFVTHCGWNSVLESIVGGVPMLCRPFFGDQRLNGGMVEGTWRIGVRVEGGVFDKEGTVEALRRVVSDEGMRENVLRLKERARCAVGPDGSSTENFKKLLGLINDPNNNIY